MANEQNLTPFKKGVVSNPKGRPKGIPNSKTILNRFLSLTEKVANPVTGLLEEMSQLEIIYLKQMAKARKGDLYSMREIVDRFEGKAVPSETTPEEINVKYEVVNHVPAPKD